MRYILTLLLAVLIPLNAAFAAVVGICDVLDHTQSEAVHFGHHSDDYGSMHTHDEPVPDSGQPASSPVACDHAHIHPGFATLLSSAVDVAPLGPRSIYVATPHRSFVSAPPIRLDRPPRTELI